MITVCNSFDIDINKASKQLKCNSENCKPDFNLVGKASRSLADLALRSLEAHTQARPLSKRNYLCQRQLFRGLTFIVIDLH